jgi:hypothetical protein
MQRGCRRAHSGEGASAVLAILAMLALRAVRGSGWLRSSGLRPPFPYAPRGSDTEGMVGTKEWVCLIELRNGG